MISRLRLVEIELFSYCNRTCVWCPNSFIDRKHHSIEIEDDVLFEVLFDLKNHNYSGPITFSRYNEPLSQHKILKKRISEIKHVLPKNKLITNTNGDFLTSEVLDGLLIDELTVMDYDGIGVKACAARLEAVGAVIESIEPPYVYACRGDMQILYVANWVGTKTITDRGGTLTQFSSSVRTSKCFEPTYFVGINYDGTVSPCCNIRSDVPKHRHYILGDLHYKRLSDILKSNKAREFRSCTAAGKFTKDSPCYRCDNTGGRYTRGEGGIKYDR